MILGIVIGYCYIQDFQLFWKELITKMLVVCLTAGEGILSCYPKSEG